MPSHTLKYSESSLQTRRQGERRCTSRITVPPGVPLTAQIETPDRILRSAQCINLSLKGALLEWGEGCPGLEEGHKLSVIIKLAGEVATLPGIVRHRTVSRIGVSFELEVVPPNSGEEQALGKILGILERAVDRRTSSPQKAHTHSSPEIPSSLQPSKSGQPPASFNQVTYSTQDRRQQERRRVPRVPVLQGIPLRAEVVTPDRILRTVRCLDLSPHGALLDFGAGKCPPLEINAQVLVNLQIGSDTVNIPSWVRHRTNNRIGVEFPFDRQSHHKEQADSLGLILRTLERAVSRRRGR